MKASLSCRSCARSSRRRPRGLVREQARVTLGAVRVGGVDCERRHMGTPCTAEQASVQWVLSQFPS
jgi:hypothetical protein